MPPAIFHAALYTSLVLCALGLLWRVSAWFRVRIGPDASAVTLFQRLAAVPRGAAAALFSRQLFRVVGAFVFDVLLQRRLFAHDKLRWLAHLLILAGFTLLLLTHALAALLAGILFEGYQSTLNPYLFLRNLFGAAVLIGVALLHLRRRRLRPNPPPARRPIDAAFVALLALVLIAGFALEAQKIASPRAFYRMTEQYIGAADPTALKPLRALWAAEYGVAFNDLEQPIAQALVEDGRERQRESCASCHTQPVSAFVSYPLARLLAPVTGILDAASADVWLLYLHVFAGFIGLALLPFTRFFHAVAGPVSLLVNAAAAKPARTTQSRSTRTLGPPALPIEARASRRALALDACVRCGICDLGCSVAPVARYLGNPGLLPSHKLVATAALAGGRLLCQGHENEALLAAEGAFLCTDCARCTSRCPLGLDLEDLWQAARGDFAAAGLAAPAQWVQARTALAWAEALEADSGQRSYCDPDAGAAPLSADRRTFSRCVQCQTCTNVCPVVANSVAPGHGVDLTPQKVMNLLRLGLRDLTLGSRMVWSCATCYQCQEHCPEGVRVADVMYELRALAVQRLGAVRLPRAAP
jgi:heterodisulfide reductase subunit C/nitrate reductase gamma subunit